MTAKEYSIEEQPRYVIDEGIPQEKETKILSEEQEHILLKLLKAGGHMLTSEERDLVYRLQDKLKRETERVKSLRKLTHADKPLDAFLNKLNKEPGNNKVARTTEGAETAEERPVQKIVQIVGFTPEEVVKHFVECWNQQKFGAEYDCFSRDFMTISRDSYAGARHLYYQQQLNLGGLRIDFGEVITSSILGGDAEVTASKVIQNGNRKPVEERDLYRLRLEKGRWLIYSVEPL